MNVDQIRETFVRFYAGRGHLRIPSASLVPHGDPTLLFTSAGMVPFKPYFMGLAEPPAPRMVTVQKVFRTTDIESVGDYSHLTFFEMLGNFSVGDYFKEGAIAYAWELLTEGFGLRAEKLHVSILNADDEAYRLWLEIGPPADRIHRYGEDHNFWFSGDVGPCGPNSEIFVDRGAREGCDFCRAGTCKPNLEPDCGRFLEVWNLVFMTLYQAEDGTRTELPKKNIDTGSGLERIACALQGKDTVYDTDIFRPILARIEELSGRTYGSDAATDQAIRVTADHVRAATFLIGDGVMPANEGRGYVLRRILRRAIYFLSQLGRAGEQTLLDRVADAVIAEMTPSYPDLAERSSFIMRLLAAEETKFRETLERGRSHLDATLHGVTGKRIDGRQAFTLYDTYGYPLELTRELAAQHGIEVDVDGFEQAMAEQRRRGRGAAKFDVEAGRLEAYGQLAHIRTRFIGYGETEGNTTIAGIIGPGGVSERAAEGDDVEVVLMETPFYPEGGGQVGDAGEIVGPGGRVAVADTRAPAEGLIVHRGRVAAGSIAVNDAVRAAVDEGGRRASQRNHTATHLLHAALRQVLGSHVRQAGSLVAPDRLRFDFTHIEATRREELAAVQTLVNEKIRADIAVHAHQESYEDAIATGALALFGEKYSAQVRVVDICQHAGETHDCFSKELCGGTHCARTGEIGAFVIESEASVGSGLRRIEALTGSLADARIIEQQELLSRLARRLSSTVEEIEARVDALDHELAAERRRAQQLERQAGRAEVDGLIETAEHLDGTVVVVARVPAGSAESLREIGDLLRARLDSSVVVLGAVISDRPSFLAMVSKDLTSRVHAGNLLKQVAAVTGGGGGGRPEMAQAGGKDAGRLDAALSVARELARERLAAR